MTLRRHWMRRSIATTTFVIAAALATATPAHAITANATTYTTNTSTATIDAGDKHVWSFSTWASLYNAPFVFGNQTGNTNNYPTLNTYYTSNAIIGSLWYVYVGVANTGLYDATGSYVAVSMNNGS